MAVDANLRGRESRRDRKARLGEGPCRTVLFLLEFPFRGRRRKPGKAPGERCASHGRLAYGRRSVHSASLARSPASAAAAAVAAAFERSRSDGGHGGGQRVKVLLPAASAVDTSPSWIRGTRKFMRGRTGGRSFL